MRFFLHISLVGLSMFSGAAWADQAAATACSTKLSKDGQLIYSKAAPTVTPKTDIKDAVISVARPMVMNGSMSRDTARAAGEAAGECLKLLK
jgi:hypothetical protein